MQTTRIIYCDPKTNKPKRFGEWSASMSLSKDFDSAKASKRLLNHNKKK